MIEAFNPGDRFKDHSLEAGLLNALLGSPDGISIVSDVLTPSAFSSEAHSAIYEDLIAGSFPDTSQLDIVDPVSDLLAAADQIRELSKKRALIVITQCARDDLKAGKTADETKAEIDASLLQVEAQARPDLFLPMPRTFTSLLDDYKRKQVRRAELGNVGLNTHIPKLNQMLGGLQPGIHILAAPPGTGKTTFTLQLATHIAAEGYPVIFLSFEESLHRLTLKALCQQAGLDLKAYTDGRGDIAALEEAMHKYKHKLDRLWIMESKPGLSVAQVKAKMLHAMKETAQRHGLIIVDYLQVWAATQRTSGSDAFRHDVSSMIAELRRLSLDLEVPVLTISSQSRGAYKKDNSGNATSSDDLSSLKESGELEYTADTAWFLINRDSMGCPQSMKPLSLSITKNRYGETGKIDLSFDMRRGAIREAADK